MPSLHLVLAAALAVLLTAPLSALGAETQPDAQAILDCVAKNQPESTAQQKMHFRAEDQNGDGREILSRVHWRRFEDGLSRVLLRVHEPQDLRGSGLLLLEKSRRADMFVYLPDLKTTRRVTSRMMTGSLFGSDFTYEDFSNLQGMQLEGRAELLADSDLDGVPVHVISHFPAEDAGSAYERVTSYIDTESCVPLKSEMYEPGGKLRKVLTADRSSIFEQNGARVPRKLLMEDLRDNTRTKLEITEIELGGDIPTRTFSVTTLERPRFN